MKKIFEQVKFDYNMVQSDYNQEGASRFTVTWPYS